MATISKASKIVQGLILLTAFVILTSCVRPAEKNATVDPELEEAAAMDILELETVTPVPMESSEPTEAPVLPTVVVAEAATEEPTPEPTDPADSVPEEEPSVTSSIVIQIPAEGEILDTNYAIRASGTGEGLPEGSLAIQALDAEGEIVITTQTTLVGENVGLGGPGTWEVSFDIPLDQDQVGALRAFTSSPADGSILAEDTVTVSFYQSVTEPFIEISSPITGTVILEESFTVSGQGGGLFEGNVVVQAEDSEGNILLTQPTVLQGEIVGIGGAGDWETTLSISAFPGTLGRIIAFSTSPADGSTIAFDSVGVTFGEAGETLIHVVQPGENLYRISLRYGVSMADIMAANGFFNPDYIYAGQELIIPPATP